MNFLNQIKARLAALFRKRELDADMDAEMRSHIELRTQANIEAGMNPEEARFAALRQFGWTETIKEDCREQRGVTWLENLAQDIRYGARQLRKNPGFTAVAVLTLALGIGANTAIFSIFTAAVLQPRQVRNLESLVRLYPSFAGEVERHMAGNRYGFSYLEYLDLLERSQAFSGVAAYSDSRLTLGSVDKEQVQGSLVSGNYFSVIGGSAVLGRALSPQDCVTPGAHPVAVLSHAFWTRRFGADTNILGKEIRLNQQGFTVVGVASRGFRGMELSFPDVWVSLMMQGQVHPKRNFISKRDTGWLQVVARLKPGVSSRQAEADVGLLARQSDRDYPGRHTTIHLAPGSSLPPAVRGKVISLTSLVMGAVGAVLLIACANVTNMLLARAAARQAEIGMRLALGAGRRRIVRQLLTESLLLATLGGAAGLLLGNWLSEFLWATMAPSNAEVLIPNPAFDLRIFVFTAGISLAAAILFGLAPALQATKRDVATVLKGDDSVFGLRLSRSRLRGILVVSQFALSLVLLSGAGLFLRTLLNSYVVEPGYATQDVAVLSIELEGSGYSDARAAQFHRQLQDRLSSLFDGKISARAAGAPLSGSSLLTEISHAAADAPRIRANMNVVSPNYFQVLEMQLIRGRHFTEHDAHTGARVIVINESAAQRLWPGEDAIGKKLREGDSGDALEVVGILRNARSVNLSESDGPFIYRVMSPASAGNGLVFLRTESEPTTLGATLRAAVRELDPKLSVTVRSLEENVERWRVPWRLGALLSGLIGLLAALLAGIGLYGVMAYSVSQRTHEMGIRIALGACRGDILRLVIRQGAGLISIGLIVGLVLALAVSRFLSSRFFGVNSTDPATFAMVVALLAGMALLACYIPALRAMKIDPMNSLRHQ